MVAWVHGRHLLQVGGDFSALNDYTDSLANGEGTFTYDSGTTSATGTPVVLGGLVDWITDYTFGVNAYPNGGCPSIVAKVHDFCFRSYSQSFGQQSLRFSTQESAAFVQEDGRATERLTVHAGMRYEVESLPQPQQPNAALDAAFGGVGATGLFRGQEQLRAAAGCGVAAVWVGAVRCAWGMGWTTASCRGDDPRGVAGYGDAEFGDAGADRRRRRRAVSADGVGGVRVSVLVRHGAGGWWRETTSALVFDRRFRLPMVQQGT